MSNFAVTALGIDHPGIVAAVADALSELGCNLEDSSMTILRGNFAIVLILAATQGVGPEQIEAALSPVAVSQGLVLDVRPAPADVEGVSTGASWTVTVHGADRPGIVHGITSVLAENGANIVDLTTRVVGGAERPLYVMAIDVTLPDDVNVAVLEAALEAKAISLGVDCRIHETETDVL